MQRSGEHDRAAKWNPSRLIIDSPCLLMAVCSLACWPVVRRSHTQYQRMHEIVQIDTIYRSKLPSYTGVTMALMTVRAAAGKLGVGYSTMKRWIATAGSGRR